MSETKKAQQEREQAEAIGQLREMFPVGSTVSTLIRHVSSSGMSRSISVLACDNGVPGDVSWLVARAGVAKFDQNHGGVKMGGAGMDMGFALVYTLARILYRDGFPCTGESDGPSRCPSNDHVNARGSDWADSFQTGRMHSDPGYALSHRWI